jgi:DNA polymerase-3 subunit delta'
MSAAETFSGAQLPWLASSRARLQTAWQQQRFPHGLLIHGPVGVGKQALAQWIAQAVLCDSSAAGELNVCGACKSCSLLAAGTHPDFTSVSPEEDKKQISVDQVRALCVSLSMTAFRQGGYKVAIIQPAQQLTMAAANSLLKTLEEPGQRTLLILVTTRSAGLLATLRSRCQHLGIRAPTPEVALAWLSKASSKTISPQTLALARGAPLRALAYAEQDIEALYREADGDLSALFAGRADVTQIAKRWTNEQLPERLLCLDFWLEQRLRTSIAGTADRFTGTILPTAGKQLNISRMFACADRLRELRAQLDRVALQRELAIEALLIELLTAVRPQAA